MSRKASVIIVSTLTGLAAIAGVTAAVRQASTPSSPEVIATPAAPAKSTQTSVPAAPLSPPPQTSPPTNSGSQETPQTPGEPSRDVQKCTIQMARVNDADSVLNVRSSPTTSTQDNIVGKLKNGTFVTVTKEQDGWFLISTPVKGWVAQSRMDFTCGIKVEQVQFGAGQDSVKIDDRFVGTGSHQYRFNLQEGQKLTVQSQRGPMPAIIAPNGKSLSGLTDQKTSWSGTLDASGDYALVLDSNFKGYKYAFTVEAK